MSGAVFLILALLSAGSLHQVKGTDNITALYGDTIVIPCNGKAVAPAGLIFVKWKYEKEDGTGDLLIKQARMNQVTVQATDGYAQRVSIDDEFSLHVTGASLQDQKTFTCMVVSIANLLEYPVSVSVQKKPLPLQILDKSEALKKGKPSQVGTCIAADANPAAEITWKRNGSPLKTDGKDVVISTSMKLNATTGLSTTSSTLQYVSTKADMDAVFTCVSTHEQGTEETDLGPFPIHYESEMISLQILPKQPIVEGDNVTLKCQADGNPPPNSYLFHIKDQKMLVENSNTYTLTGISREDSGEYKCSLADNEKMEDTQNIVVNYLDFTMNATGKLTKRVGDKMVLKINMDPSDKVNVSCTKNKNIVDLNPNLEFEFGELSFSDAGVYVCEASMAGLIRRQSLELVVVGKPVITNLSKQRDVGAKHKVLTCEAEGFPEPSIHWSINGTNEESFYVNGKATYKITVIPNINLTVTCSVSNKFGKDDKSVNISSLALEINGPSDSSQESKDHAKLIVAVSVGLLIVAALGGLIYWLYMKNTRQGSWKTREDLGTPEENKKLEENNHTA